MKRTNLLKDVYRIVYDTLGGHATRIVEAWSESDAIADTTERYTVYSIVDIKRVA